MRTGDTFFPNVGGSHLCVIIVVSDPDPDGNDVGMVNVTSDPPDGDETTILKRGDHSFLSNEFSFLYYGGAKVGFKSKLQASFDSKLILPNKPFSGEVMIRILEGAIKSKSSPDKFKALARKALAEFDY